MKSPLTVLALVALALPAAAVVSPAVLDALDGHEVAGPDGDGPPLYAPNGYGAFPAEGSLGTHGCAATAGVADVLAGRYAEGAGVCLETSLVVDAATVRSGDGKDARRGSFTLRAPDGAEIGAEVSRLWWSHGTPAPGMVVVVEGNVTRDGAGEWRVDPVLRWVDLNHPGEVVDAWRVAAGLVPEGTYVWINHTTVYAVWRNNDGPNNVGDDHVETGTMCPTAHLTTETTPPYFGIVQAPPVGATVRMYGATRYDDGHGWWEIHPIRAWEILPSEDLPAGCPERFGESGWPPPGFVPDKIPPLGAGGGA